MIDVFVDSMNMAVLGFVRSTPVGTGRLGYNSRGPLKLHLYGYLRQVRS